MKEKITTLFLLISIVFSQHIFSQREVTLGTNTTFNGAITSYVRSDKIDDTHILTVYRNGGPSTTSADIMVVVGEVSGTTITYGTPTIVEADLNRYASVVVLSSTTAIVSYEFEGGATDSGYSRVITFDTTSDAITNVGLATDMGHNVASALSHNPISMVKLTETTFAIAYSNNDSTDDGIIRIGTVNAGPTISYGGDNTFSTSDINNPWLTALSSSKIIISFEDDGDALDAGIAMVGDISGTTVTFGIEYPFNGTPTVYPVSQAISSTEFVTVYIVDDANDYVYTKIGTVSGTVISFGSANALDVVQTANDDLTIDYLGANEFVVAYNGDDSGGHSKVRVGKVSGASITYNTEDIFLTSLLADDSWVTAINSETIAIVYIDDQETTPAADLGEYIVGTLPINTWSGATNNDWDTSTNWSVDVPDSFSNAQIPSGITNYPTAATAITINNLTIASGASLLANSTFTGNVTYNVNITDTNWHLISAPVEGEQYDDTWNTTNSIDQTGQTNTLAGVSTYSNTTDADGDWNYFTIGNPAETFNTGQGYSMLRTGAGDYGFIGTMKTTDASIAITANDIGGGGENRWTLIGNPFPSYVSIDDFLGLAANATALTDTHESVYVWNGTAYVALTTGYIHPGQGFFVNSNVASTSVAINENMLSHQTGVTFYRNAATTDPSIELMLSDGQNTRTTEINYTDGKTTGLDPRFDIGTFTGTSNSFHVYTQLISDNQNVNFMRQTLPNSNHESLIVPVGVNADTGEEITFTANALNIPNGLNVFIEDRDLGVYTQLDVANAEYSVTLSSDLNGIGRFYLHTNTQSALSTGSFELNKVSIYKTSTTNLRIVGLQNGNASLSIFDVLGKQVLQTSFEASGVHDITLPNVKTGVYIIRLSIDNGTLNKKIILNN